MFCGRDGILIFNPIHIDDKLIVDSNDVRVEIISNSLRVINFIRRHKYVITKR